MNAITSFIGGIISLFPHPWILPTIIVLLITGIIYISVFGRFDLTFGFWKFGLGHLRNKNRSCGDCILILFGKGKKHETERNYILNDILRDQMNFVEQKIFEVQMELTQSYIKDLNKYGKTLSELEKYKQLKLYSSLLKNALTLAKDFVRKNCKENHFCEWSGVEYSNYVKDKTQSLISLVQGFFIENYPSDMVIDLPGRFSRLDERKIEDVVFEIYNYAKQTKINAEQKIQEIDIKFKDDINLYVEKLTS